MKGLGILLVLWGAGYFCLQQRRDGLLPVQVGTAAVRGGAGPALVLAGDGGGAAAALGTVPGPPGAAAAGGRGTPGRRH